MKLAVLMSTYNGEQYLCAQLDSILAQQTDFAFDIWVRDDGSKDSTREILQRYADEGKLQWYTGENLRPARSFMDLLLHCPGYDYYAFADQDDHWLPEKLAAGVKKLAGISGPAFSFANATLVDQDLNSLGRDVYKACPTLSFPALSVAGGILGCTMILNRELAELLSARPRPEILVMHDFYVAQVCLLAGGTVVYDQTPRMYYRQHGNNVVGVSRSKLAAIKDRLRTVTKPVSVTVGQQARAVLDAYPELGEPAQRRWLERLADRRFFARLGVACSFKTRYTSRNQSITLRLALLLGNR